MTLQSNMLFLGTGGSMGVPVIACHCNVCHSDISFNKRMRSSVLLTVGHKTILIDAGPDLRQQLLTYRIDKIDGIMLTHSHNDHTAGIDDLRAFVPAMQTAMPILLSQETLEDIKKRFYYIFRPHDEKGYLTTQFNVTLLQADKGDIPFLGLNVRYMSYEQCGMKVTGFRVGDMAYVSDIKHYNDGIFNELQGVDTLILSALRFTPSHMHLSVDEAIDFARKAGARQTFLTHISHDLDHHVTNAYLPKGIAMAYDGLSLTFNAELADN